ncbi:MAG: DUF4252 domain-containing protein [Tannerella sp.]|jgi:hypothetical protein|nr:DUF4252 domain-containing protein [Tannerella sp.]
MKAKYILAVIGLGIGSLCFGQQKLFDRFAGQDGVSSVYISKAMFEMMPSLGDMEGVKLSNLKKIEGINILSSERESVSNEMRKVFKALITDRHEELLRIRDGSEDITFHVRKNGSNIEELIMLIDRGKSFTVIQILGNFSLQDIQEIATQVEL